MYYLSKKEYKRDWRKVLMLGLIIGISIGVCLGFLWATATIDEIIRAGVIRVPQQMRAIPF